MTGLRVALVCPYSLDTPGGVATHVLGLARWLLEQGHDPVVVAPGEQEVDRGVPVVLLGPAHAFRFNGSVARLAVSHRQRVMAVRAVADADVVHVHEPLTPGAGYATARASSALVVTHHASFDPAHLATTLRLRASRLPADRISVAVSAAAAATARAAIGYEPLIIPNAITMPPPAPARPAGRPLVVFLGRQDEPRKGYPLFAALAQSVPEADFVAIGPGGPGATGVRELGRLDDRAAAEILDQATVLVAPNRFGESFGLILLEGLAHGCAVVASDLPAFRAVVDHPGVISWFPVDDVVSARAALRRRLDDPPPPAAARALAERYSWDHVGPRIVELYARVTTRAPGADVG